MDGSRFDAWTRRRFGFVASGLAASAFGLAGLGVAAAKKKRKKKKQQCPELVCKNELERCDPSLEGQSCCPALNCDLFGDDEPERLCCLGLRSPCVAADNHCCGDLSCKVGSESPEFRCCADLNDPCSDNFDCCVNLACEQGRCEEAISDRALKANFASVDPVDMLERVRALRIGTGHDTSDASLRHIGPRPPDFAAVFGVGTGDRPVHPIDGQGVALAAIQGLASLMADLRAENAQLAARVRQLERAPN